jgi:hypothetical protein
VELKVPSVTLLPSTCSIDRKVHELVEYLNVLLYSLDGMMVMVRSKRRIRGRGGRKKRKMAERKTEISVLVNGDVLCMCRMDSWSFSKYL